MTATDLDWAPGDEDEAPSPLYAPDAERALVGEVLFRPAAAKAAAALVSPADFANDRLGQVYGLVIGMVSAVPDPAAVDFHAVRAEITVRRKAHELGVDRPDRGARLLPPTNQPWRWAEVRWLSDGDVAVLMTEGRGNVEGPAREIRDAADRRRVVANAQETITAAYTTSDVTVLAAQAVDRFRAVRDTHAVDGRLATRTLREVFETVDPGYEWVIPGLLERADRLILTGKEGAGKSYLMRQLALCAAAGVHPFKLTPIPPVRVVVVDVENSERQWRRKAQGIARQAARLGSVDPRDAVQLVCLSRMDLTSAADLAGVHRLLDDHEPDILVIGPLYKCLPNAINNDTDAAPLIVALDSLRERGPALLMEAHAGHAPAGSGATWDYRPRGSRALMGWPEFGFGLAPDKEAPDVAVEIRRWRGDRDEREWPARLIRGGVFPWSDEEEPAARPSAHQHVEHWNDRDA